MNREAYRLANEIGKELEADGDCLRECLSDVEMKRYESMISEEIKKEKRAGRRSFRRIDAAACGVLVLAACTAAFGEEVNAAVRQIGWSISEALGLSGNLADYREVVNTSVSDQGYVITLREAVVSNEELVITYTLQREDKEPMEEILTPDGILYMNGKAVSNGSSGNSGFLDEEQTLLGSMASYNLSGMDLSAENEYRLVFDRIGILAEGTKGMWVFAFTADGADLIADTKRISIGREYRLPDGTEIILDTLTLNELEQRITYSQSGSTRYMLMVKAADSNGNRAEFGLRSADETSGYLQNEEIIDDGRIDETSRTVTLTLYAVELPQEDGRISGDPIPVGDPFELGL